MQDKELAKLIGMPTSTLSEWKKAKNYRIVLYELLKSLNVEELKKKVEAIKLLKGIE